MNFNLIDRLLDRIERVYEPGAAGIAPGLDRCEKTEAGYECRWARARMSPGRMVQLGRDLQSVVDGGEPEVELRWGSSLRRTYGLDQLADLPLESLRRAHTITITAEGSADGARAEVSLDATREPGLAASVRGPADVAQKVKDAVELGYWNPWSGRKLRAGAFSLVAYGVLALAMLFGTKAPGWAAFLLLVGAAALAVLAGDIGGQFKRLWPPVEIYAVEHTSVSSVLRSAVPIIAGVAGLVATVLKILGLGG
jgi:hypothetical protein